jgi:hypothetical protein
MINMPSKSSNPVNDGQVASTSSAVDQVPFNGSGAVVDLNGSATQLAKEERIVYTYHLNAGTVHVEIIIAVEPFDLQSSQYTFTLAVKAGDVERALCDPVVLNVFIDPRELDFAAFMFPPKASLPVGCLYCLRVWLRSGKVDHRLFAENEFWIGRNPEFSGLGDATYAQLASSTPSLLVYQSIVGGAPVNFILKWHLFDEDWYKFSLEYEAGGVGRTLFDDHRLRLTHPGKISFVIYSVPITSTPPNASHRLRVWICTPSSDLATSTVSFPNDSYIYQRLWKSDNFKVGSELNFEALGSKTVIGLRDSRSPQIESNVLFKSLPVPTRSQRNTESSPLTVQSFYEDNEGEAV